MSLIAIAFILIRLHPVGAEEDARRPEYYTTRVKPILDQNCAKCHGGMNRRGGLNLNTRAAMLRGGKDGVVLVPGDPANSLLVKVIRHEGITDEAKVMPPKKAKLPDADIATIERWIKAGAVMPE